MKPLIPEVEVKTINRRSGTSFMKQNTKLDGLSAVRAYRDVFGYIQDNRLNIKTAIDMMAGKGVMSSYILQLPTLQDLILNDRAEDCYQYLKDKFKHEKRVRAIWNKDYREISLGDSLVDLVVIDFNNFTWNKKDLVEPFKTWLEHNRDYFRYLLYCDSFYFSLKFLNDEEVREVLYEFYLKRVENELGGMRLLTAHDYQSKSCSLFLLEYQ